MKSLRLLHRLGGSLPCLAMLVTLALGHSCACAAAAEPEFFPIWSSPKEDGVAGYHLPQILVTRRGTVIALAEARHRWGDGVKTDVVIRRSGDGGRTWSKSLFVARAEGEDNHVLPVLLEERTSRRIFFFCARRNEGVKDKTTENFYRTSDDDGLTWSAERDITAILTAADAKLQTELRAGRSGPEFAGDDPELFGRQLFFFGPGRPIQLSTRHARFPDRLVVPLFIMKDRLFRPRAKRAYGNGVLVSDDRGATWRVGGIAPLGEYGSSEVSIVELDDGRLLLNARGAPPESNGFSVAGRTLSYSSDGGATWTRPRPDDSGIPHYPETHSGLLRIPATENKPARPSLLLFSFPAALPPADSQLGVALRGEGTILLSDDQHRSWSVKKLIRPGSFGYSNMDQLSDGTVLLTFGNARVTEVNIARFTIDWLTTGKNVSK